MDGAEADVRCSGSVGARGGCGAGGVGARVVEVPEIERHVAPVQIQAVVSELIHVLPR